MKNFVTAIALGSALMAPLGLAQQTARRANDTNVINIPRGKTTYLGIGVADIDSDRAKALNLREEYGVEIKSVEADSPADKAGLKQGDVVLQYNGQRIEGIEQFIRLVKETPSGRKVNLAVWRNGSEQTVSAVTGSRESKVFAFAFPDGKEFNMAMPPMPPIPPMPPMTDLPRPNMSWRSSALGIESEAVGSQLAEFFGVKEGVLVRSVTKNSAAEKAGIKAGDVIVKVDGTAVTSAREISSALRSAKNRSNVAVVLVRDKREMTVTVALEGDSFRGERRETERVDRMAL